MLRDFIVNEVVGGPMGVGGGGPGGAVRGFYTDDSWGEANCSADGSVAVGTCGPTEMDP